MDKNTPIVLRFCGAMLIAIASALFYIGAIAPSYPTLVIRQNGLPNWLLEIVGTISVTIILVGIKFLLYQPTPEGYNEASPPETDEQALWDEAYGEGFNDGFEEGYETRNIEVELDAREEFCPFTSCSSEGCVGIDGHACNCKDCPSCDGNHVKKEDSTDEQRTKENS